MPTSTPRARSAPFTGGRGAADFDKLVSVGLVLCTSLSEGVGSDGRLPFMVMCRSLGLLLARHDALVQSFVLGGAAVPRPVLTHAVENHLSPLVGPAAIHRQRPPHGVLKRLQGVGAETEARRSAVG